MTVDRGESGDTVEGTRHPHLLLIVGDLDHPVMTRMTPQAALFQDGGLTVELQILPSLGHTVPGGFVDRAWAWLQRPLP